MRKRIGYLRTSTQEQCLDRQILGLRPLCDELHVERLSAVARRRPVYEQVIASLRPGDTLVVLDLDRAFRSVLDALTEAERLRARGVAFHIANLQVDTGTESGMLVYTMMSACAEFERRTLARRTREGLAAARERGKRLGRPPKLNAEQLAAIRARMAEETLTAIAKDYDVAPWSLTRALRREARTNGRESAPA